MQNFGAHNNQWQALIDALQTTFDHHSPSSKLYKYFNIAAVEMAVQTFGKDKVQEAVFSDACKVTMPFFPMGAINSTHLFGLDELIIFSYYLSNRQRYKNAADIGANIGLHSIFMAKCGWNVTSYEPDPIHAKRFLENVRQNGVDNKIALHEKAVSSQAGRLEFVRVPGNKTGSHLAGTKQNAYGELEKLLVAVDGIDQIIGKFDLVKLDIEGQEAIALCATTREQWSKSDAIIEVGSDQNAQMIFDHFNKIGVGMFPQKIGWKRATSVEQLPVSYKQGSLFISSKSQMIWNT